MVSIESKVNIRERYKELRERIKRERAWGCTTEKKQRRKSENERRKKSQEKKHRRSKQREREREREMRD